MDKNSVQGYNSATQFEADLRVRCTVTEQEMDKDFLNQIDGVNELISLTEKLHDEVLICECFCVNVADIRETCQALGTFDLKIMQERFSMGLGCQSCINRIDTWVNKIF